MPQAFLNPGMSQELAGLCQMGLGVRQSNGHEAIEVIKARRLVTLVRRSDFPADMTAVAAPEASPRESRRVEKPLLTQVLRPATFKAQYERKSMAKDSAAISDIIDVLMNDVEATRPLCDTAPDTAISSRPGMRDDQSIPGATAEGVNINAPKVVDQDT